jgi:hypothetical protein
VLEWLTRWWRDLLRDVVLTGLGGYVIYSQALSPQPRWQLLLVGVALISPATAVNLLRAVAGASTPPPSPPPLPPPGPEPQPASPGGAGEHG